jgi:hypothetical protein
MSLFGIVNPAQHNKHTTHTRVKDDEVTIGGATDSMIVYHEMICYNQERYMSDMHQHWYDKQHIAIDHRPTMSRQSHQGI